MKSLLTVFALVEVSAGVILAISPLVLTRSLFGTELEFPTAIIAGRVAGVALLSLVIGCWVARNDARSLAAKGLVAGMLLYNAGIVALLLHAGRVSSLTGVLLWPAIVVHAALAAWCIVCVWNNVRNVEAG